MTDSECRCDMGAVNGKLCIIYSQDIKSPPPHLSFSSENVVLYFTSIKINRRAGSAGPVRRLSIRQPKPQICLTNV